MKRPIGVILTCIVLGLIGAIQLLSAVFMAVAAIIVQQSAKHPAGDFSLQNSGFLTSVMVVLGLVWASLGACAISTVVGLARLRNWARYSILVIGGCLAALSLFALIGLGFAALLTPSLLSSPNISPDSMHIVLISEALFWIAAAALAGWWLVYFNLRSTKAYFLPGYQSDSSLQPGCLPPSPPARPPGRFAHLPVPILILAVLQFLGALCCLPYVLLPFPVFFFGAIIDRPGTYFVWPALSLFLALIGYGLLKLNNLARQASIALIALAAVNACYLVTPSGTARFNAYMQTFMDRFQVPGVPHIAFPTYTLPMMIFSALFGLAVDGVILWILHHYRAAFTTPPPANA